MKTHQGPESDHAGSSPADRQVGKALLSGRGPAAAARVLVQGEWGLWDPGGRSSLQAEHHRHQTRAAREREHGTRVTGKGGGCPEIRPCEAKDWILL